MYWLVALMSFAIAGLIARPVSGAAPGAALRLRRWSKPAMGGQLLLFVGAQFGLLLLGINEVFAEETTVEVVGTFRDHHRHGPGHPRRRHPHRRCPPSAPASPSARSAPRRWPPSPRNPRPWAAR
jgi:hypothetical protein